MSQMPPAAPPSGSMAPHRGTMILVLGIVGFFCFLVAIAAWLMGKKDLAEMDAGRMDPAGRQNTKIGMILGIVFTILGAIGIVINILLRVMG